MTPSQNGLHRSETDMKRFASIPSFGAAAVAALLWTTPAHAQSDRPWSVSFDAGAQLAVSGDAHGGANGTVLSLPTSVQAKSYGDVFGPGFFWAASVGYKVSPNGEIRVSGSYTANPADQLQVGTVATLPLFAAFHDYKAFGMDFGYRQYLSAGSVQPFVGGSVGFTRVNAIDSTLTVPAANVTLANVPFYADSTLPSFAINGGAQMRINDMLAFQAGVELRWHGDLEQNEGLAGTGLETINDKTRRWAMPVTAGLTVRF
jgi:hypothetical protein